MERRVWKVMGMGKLRGLGDVLVLSVRGVWERVRQMLLVRYGWLGV